MTTTASRNQTRRPVPRARVAGAALLGGLVLFGVVALAEVLRHPPPEAGPVVVEQALPGADPRTEVACEELAPREGQPREEVDLSGRGPIEVTSNQLYDCPQVWDNTVVLYRGEVVGAVLQRGGGAWVQLNDDVYGNELGPLPAHRDYRGGNAGVGVFIPAELVEAIEFVGGPDAEGDVLVIVGTFHRVDPRSGEVAIIRAEIGDVAVRGGPFVDPLLRDRRAVALLLAAVAVGLVVAERAVARRHSAGLGAEE